jgi:hypothetical protein
MPTYDDEPEQQSDENPAESDQPTAQSDDAPADSDQSTQESDEKPAEESDQPADQAEEQPTDTDQTTAQSEGQPPSESDQSAWQPDKATGGGGPTDDAVAADSAGGSKRSLKVIAEFTQEGGDSFSGDILINLYVYDKSGYRARYNDGWSEWRDAGQASNKISTDASLPNLNLVQVGIVPSARAAMIDTRTGSLRFFEAIKGDEFKFPIPSSGKSATLQTRFDVEVKPFETIIKGAPDAQKALEGLPGTYEYRFGVFNWKTEKITSQDFRFTGKYYTGVILSKVVK